MSSAASNPEVEPSNNEEEKNTSVSTEPEPSINDGKPKEFVKTLDVPKWLSDEDVIGKLLLVWSIMLEFMNALHNIPHDVLKQQYPIPS